VTLKDSAAHQEKAPRGAFSAASWDLGGHILTPAGRPLVMGILNITPDSFHAPSRKNDVAAAVREAVAMATAGADLLDLGAESTRPGADEISAQQEMDRLLPVIEAVGRETDLPLTVDTHRAATAKAALDAGAHAVNDICAGQDPAMFSLVAERGCGLILMHMQGTPRTMQKAPTYQDVVIQVKSWLDARCALAVAAGIPEARLVVDPGIGFGKTLEHNLALLGRLDLIAAGKPLLLGASRKSFIGTLTGADTHQRLPGSLAALAVAYQANVSLVRVHDVAESVQFLNVLQAASA